MRNFSVDPSFDNPKRLTFSPSTGILAWIAVLAVAVGLLAGFLVGKDLGTMITIAVPLALVAVVAVIIQPEWGLLLLVVVSYTRLSDIATHFYNAPSLAKPLLALLGFVILVRWVAYHEEPKDWLRSAVLIGAYGLVVFASLLYAADLTRAENTLSDFLKDGAITVIVVMMLQRGESLRRVIWALLASGLFLGSISVAQYLTGSFSNTYWGFGQANLQNIAGANEGFRIGGPIGDPNYFAQILVVLVPLAMNRMMQEKNRWLRLLAAATLGICILTIFFTFSRGGFLSLMVVLISMFLYRPPKIWQILLLLILVVFVVNMLPDQFAARLSTLTDLIPGQVQVQGDVSFQGRASEATVAWMMFLDHPFLGVGASNYPVYYLQYSRRLGLDPRLEQREPHDLYLEVLSEMGLSGFLVFLLILWTIFQGLGKARSDLEAADEKDYGSMVAAILIGMIGYLTSAIFIHGAYPRYFWLLAGIAMATPNVVRTILAERTPVEVIHRDAF
jgi:putative inorganic carbon (hco3(-)) transporter